MNDLDEASLLALDDQEIARRINTLERDVLAAVCSDNWNIEAQPREEDALANS